MKKILIYVILSIFCFLPFISAAPYSGELYKFKQPDGSFVDVKLYGDEYYIFAESLRGHSLIVDPKTRIICFAKLSADGKTLVSTGITYNNKSDIYAEKHGLRDTTGTILNKHLHIKSETLMQITNEKRQKRIFQKMHSNSVTSSLSSLGTKLTTYTAAGNVVGSYKGLILLIDFPDEPATITKSQVENFANQLGYTEFGNNGSVRDFYKDVSNNHLDYTNYVTDYYTAVHNKSYYTDPTRTYSAAAQELIKEALNNLKNVYAFDFTTLSNSGGYITAINVFYAGQCTNNWGEGLWPHSSSMGYYSFTSNGLTAGDYQITNMKSSSGVDELTIATFCHENGHMLMGWPDLYDYGHDSAGVGYYDLMGSGTTYKKNPPPPSAYLRDIAGWETRLGNLNSSSAGTFYVDSNTSSSYKFVNPANSRESFYVESRQKTGRSINLPDSGLMIWHIDQDGSNDNQQMTTASHYLVSLEQADGLFHLENNSYVVSQDLYKAGYAVNFDNTSVPNSKWWSMAASGFNVGDVGPVASTMYFSIATPTVTATYTYTFTLTVTKTVTLTYTQTDTSTVTQTPTQTFTQTITDTYTQTYTASITQTSTNSPTITETFTITPTFTPIIIDNDKAFAYPNPFVKSKTQQIKFIFKPASDCKIQIYNVNLIKVMSLSVDMIYASEGRAVWNLRDINGKVLPIGIYFATINTNSSKNFIKFSVLE